MRGSLNGHRFITCALSSSKPLMTALLQPRTFTALAQSEDLRLDYRMSPGDIAMLSNLTMVHAKTAFKDHAEPAKARHLLRLWVSPDNAPALPEDSAYKAIWGSVQVGSRGGYWMGHNYVRAAPLLPEYGDLDSTRPPSMLQPTLSAAK